MIMLESPTTVFLLLLLTPAVLTTACPFNTSDVRSPCNSAHCTTIKSSVCKIYVDRFCLNYPLDPGCLLFQPRTGCPFNLTIPQGNPCFDTRCDDAGSDQCRSHVDTYCASNPNDLGCVIFIDAPPTPSSTSPSARTSPSPATLSCPFNTTSDDNPCSNDACNEDTKGDQCKSYVEMFCTKNSNDQGCVLFATSSTVSSSSSSSSSSCPFNTTSDDNPCSNNECNENTKGDQCKSYVEMFCTKNSNDQGCVLFATSSSVSSSSSSSSSCPFNTTSDDNPCSSSACYASTTSPSCQDAVSMFCESNPSDDGCLLFVPVVIVAVVAKKGGKYCPFNGSLSGTPCDHDDCIASTTSSACQQVVSEHCTRGSGSNMDSGCLLFMSKPACPTLHQRLGCVSSLYFCVDLLFDYFFFFYK